MKVFATLRRKLRDKDKDNDNDDLRTSLRLIDELPIFRNSDEEDMVSTCDEIEIQNIPNIIISEGIYGCMPSDLSYENQYDSIYVEDMILATPQGRTRINSRSRSASKFMSKNSSHNSSHNSSRKNSPPGSKNGSRIGQRNDGSNGNRNSGHYDDLDIRIRTKKCSNIGSTRGHKSHNGSRIKRGVKTPQSKCLENKKLNDIREVSRESDV